MAGLPDLTVAAHQAASAYRRVEQGAAPNATESGASAATADFGAVLGRALNGAVTAGRDADAQSMAVVAGGGNLTSAVTALSRADLALQTTVAIRDRVVQAYQDIMKMPI